MNAVGENDPRASRASSNDPVPRLEFNLVRGYRLFALNESAQVRISTREDARLCYGVGRFCFLIVRRTMEPAQEAVRPVWSKRKPARRSAPAIEENKTDLILGEQRTASGDLLGPYETAYDLSSGYGVERVIVRP